LSVVVTGVGGESILDFNGEDFTTGFKNLECRRTICKSKAPCPTTTPTLLLDAKLQTVQNIVKDINYLSLKLKVYIFLSAEEIVPYLSEKCTGSS
jgi:hypothetical protein